MKSLGKIKYASGTCTSHKLLHNTNNLTLNIKMTRHKTYKLKYT